MTKTVRYQSKADWQQNAKDIPYKIFVIRILIIRDI